MTDEKKTKFAFIITVSLLVGSFLGGYYGRKVTVPESPIIEADKILNTGTSDKAQLAKVSDLASLVLATDPKNCKAMMTYALSLQRRGLTVEAIKQYEKLIAESDNFSKLSNYNVGALYELVGQLEDAEIHYNQSIARDPGIPIFWANLIKLLVKQNKIEEAKSSLESALKIIPTSQELLLLKPLVGMP